MDSLPAWCLPGCREVAFARGGESPQQWHDPIPPGHGLCQTWPKGGCRLGVAPRRPARPQAGPDREDRRSDQATGRVEDLLARGGCDSQLEAPDQAVPLPRTLETVKVS